jgi:hypothetical protein
MLFSGLIIALQIACIVHCIRTGRNVIWVWVLLVPAVGIVAYSIVELLPALTGSRGSRRALANVSRAINPGRDLRRYESAAKFTGDVASQQRYAAELLRQGRVAEAVAVYKRVLTGLYAQDPNLMLGLAEAQFALPDAAAARRTLDELIQHNPEFKSPAGHLLYARALEAEGDRSKALAEYAAVAAYYAGAEAAVRHAQLLKAEGQREQARTVLLELREHARNAPRHYRRAQSEWLALGERELAGL